VNKNSKSLPIVKKYTILVNTLNTELAIATMPGMPKNILMSNEPKNSIVTKIIPSRIISVPGKSKVRELTIKYHAINIVVVASTLPPAINEGRKSLMMKNKRVNGNPNCLVIIIPRNKVNLKSIGVLLYLS